MNSRILLINTLQEHTLHAGVDDVFVDMIGYYPPLGLLYLAAVLKNEGFEVKVLDCVPQKISYSDLRAEIQNFKPYLVGISTYTTTMADVLLTANLVKEIDSQIFVVLGGHHPHLFPSESITYKNIDYILQGEGEYTFPQLIRGLQNQISDSELLKIDGIGFLREGEKFLNPKKAYIENLDSLPFPAREMLPADLYKSIVGRNEKVATIMSSRGCPFRCTFCFTPNKSYRTRSTENIIAEVKELVANGYKEIFFFDDLFALKPQKVIDFSRSLRENNLKIEWSFRARISTISKELVEEVKLSGCHRIQFGIEAGLDKTLKRIKKDTNAEMIRNAIKLCKEAKIQTIGSFILGLPDQTKEDMFATINFSREIGLNYVQYNILIPYPFTEIYEEGLRENVFSNDFWKEFVENPIEKSKTLKIQYWTKEVSEEFLFDLTKKAFKSFYFRPSFIFSKLREIKTLQEFKNAISGALSVFNFKT